MLLFRVFIFVRACIGSLEELAGLAKSLIWGRCQQGLRSDGEEVRERSHKPIDQMKKLLTIAAATALYEAITYGQPAQAQKAPLQSAASSDRMNTPAYCPDPSKDYSIGRTKRYVITYSADPTVANPHSGCITQFATHQNVGVREPGGCIYDIQSGMRTCSSSRYAREKMYSGHKLALRKGLQPGSNAYSKYMLDHINWWLKVDFYKELPNRCPANSCKVID